MENVPRRANVGERPFSCNLCEYSAVRKDHLKLHIRGHLQEKPFKCPEVGCNYSSVDTGNVRRHHRTVHLGEKRFQCPISGCEYKCEANSKLTRHMTTHEENPDKPFKCHLCPYKSKTNNLDPHIRSHLQERPFICQESGCTFAASFKGTLTMHHKMVHLGEKRFQCPISTCGKRFGAKHSLANHMTTHEENPDRPFKCHLCIYKGKRNISIQRHVLHVHSNERNFKCPFEQDGCTYAAKTKAHLNMHLQTHGEKNLSCSHPNCEYKTNSKECLRSHLKIHISKDVEKRHKCNICDYSTHFSGAFNNHIRVHTKEKPFKCKVGGCSYQAKCWSNVRSHEKCVHEKN